MAKSRRQMSRPGQEELRLRLRYYKSRQEAESERENKYCDPSELIQS